MTYVKISELPTMQELSNTDILPIVDVSETETKKITKQNLLTDINAEEVQIGLLTEATQINDEDYLIITQNGTNKKISKANAKFASGDEIYVGDTEPTGEDDDSVKLWIEPSEDSADAEGTYISNEYGIAQDKGYSQEYLNGKVLYEDDENGTTGDITLTDDVSNYRYIEITWGVNGTAQQTRETIKYNVTNDMHVMYIRPYITSILYLYSTQLAITGTSVTVEKYSRGQYNNQSLDINFNYIFKIVGYK